MGADRNSSIPIKHRIALPPGAVAPARTNSGQEADLKRGSVKDEARSGGFEELDVLTPQDPAS